MTLGLYPNWVFDPTLTMELLASIRLSCKTGQPLDDEQRQYLIDCIDRLIEKKLPAAKAFYLSGRMGQQRRTLSDRNIVIYNRVEKLREQGYSDNRAFKKVATESIARKPGGNDNLSDKAIEKICKAIDRIINRSQSAAVKSASENTQNEK